MMLSRITGRPLVETPQLFLKSNGSTRFHEMRKALKAVPGGESAASKLKKYKRKYEEYAESEMLSPIRIALAPGSKSMTTSLLRPLNLSMAISSLSI